MKPKNNIRKLARLLTVILTVVLLLSAFGAVCAGAAPESSGHSSGITYTVDTDIENQVTPLNGIEIPVVIVLTALVFLTLIAAAVTIVLFLRKRP